MTYSTATAASRRAYAPNQNQTRFQTRAKSAIGPVSNIIILTVLACLLMVIYLSQVTRTTGFSYSLDELRVEQTALTDKLSSLEAESSRLKSIEKIKQSEVATTLVEAESVRYVSGN